MLFIFDTFIDFYCLSFDTITIKNKYPKLSFFKAVIVAFMLVDYIVFIAGASNGDRPIRPFRILRVSKYRFIQLCRLYMTRKQGGH